MNTKNATTHKENNLPACCGKAQKIKGDSKINSSAIDKGTSD